MNRVARGSNWLDQIFLQARPTQELIIWAEPILPTSSTGNNNIMSFDINKWKRKKKKNRLSNIKCINKDEIQTD